MLWRAHQLYAKTFGVIGGVIVATISISQPLQEPVLRWNTQSERLKDFVSFMKTLQL